MSKAKETINRLANIRAQLAPIGARLLNIEASLEAAKEADRHQPRRMSLREFTAQLFGEETSRTQKCDCSRPQDRLVNVR